MVVCCGCDEGFHLSCHSPPLPEQVTIAKWFCSGCSTAFFKQKTEADVPETCALDTVKAKIGSEGKLDDDEIDDSVPDASCWSVDQVYRYLSDQGFPEEAAILRHHGIDGPSLLLMKRDDVLIELSLKLGPALKLYKQVKKLQIRRSEEYFFWP
ncbi:sterile alpha motif domain-containing protein 13 [Bacillus rossius redtenbacheri]|uniref:sterile alpha motif domain-containing protein 13 n=1 Tax=Bacillus rossius redtenbacheri TaxID=93214 RepID=UPI002FDE00F8